jgi:NADPH:quinone reductase-like Zn-dependent oxidoreductase
MKAIQVKQPGGPEVLELVDIPVPEPKPNEALVKIAASGVNFIDVYQREGRYPVPLPFVIGQEGAGVVTQAGTEVKSVAVGDRVAVVLSPGLVPPPSGPPLVPLSVALPEGVLAELAGVSLGVADVGGLADLAGADDAEPDAHAIADALPRAPEVLPPAPPAAEPIAVPSPFVL